MLSDSVTDPFYQMLKLQHRESSCPSPHHGRVRTQVWQSGSRVCVLTYSYVAPKRERTARRTKSMRQLHSSGMTEHEHLPGFCSLSTPPAPPQFQPCCSHRLICRCICAEEISKKDLCLCL